MYQTSGLHVCMEPLFATVNYQLKGYIPSLQERNLGNIEDHQLIKDQNLGDLE